MATMAAINLVAFRVLDAGSAKERVVPVPNVNVEVRRDIPGQPMQMPYADPAGATPLGNPFVAATGAFRFHVPGGYYRIRAYLGDPAAQITPARLRLAEWIATTYRAPLYEALALLLPPGVGQEAITTWRATPNGMAAEPGAPPQPEPARLL